MRQKGLVVRAAGLINRSIVFFYFLVWRSGWGWGEVLLKQVVVGGGEGGGRGHKEQVTLISATLSYVRSP